MKQWELTLGPSLSNIKQDTFSFLGWTSKIWYLHTSQARVHIKSQKHQLSSHFCHHQHLVKEPLDDLFCLQNQPSILVRAGIAWAHIRSCLCAIC
jgi:hypothetical protein